MDGKQQGEGGVFAVRVSRPPLAPASRCAKDSPMRTRKGFRRADRNGRSLIGDVDGHGIGSGPDVDVAPSMPGATVQERVEDLGGGSDCDAPVGGRRRPR